MSINGPYLLENWLAADRGAALIRTIEVPLYSDAWITGEATGRHPYEVINLVPIYAPTDAPSLVLRADVHVEWEFGPLNETDDSKWTGARSLGDELAALLSLAMGARIAAGAVTRYFEPGEDPKGRPRSDLGPKLPPRNSLETNGPMRLQRKLLRSALGPTGVDPAILDLLRNTPPTLLTPLIRAARAFRDALWLCEDEPALAWLLFVGAVEAAASTHRDTAPTDPAMTLRATAPKKFIGALDSLNAEAVETIAPHVVKFFGSTARFLGFVDAFFPPEPSKRSMPPHSQVDWSRDSIKRALRRVYECRSDALHAGIPFPPPMYFPPMTLTDDVPAERPFGGGVHGGTWTSEDCPMHLHIFEHIARHTLVAWWRSIASQ